jgi:hypothetical protein
MEIKKGNRYRFEFVENNGFTNRAIYEIKEINSLGIRFKGYKLLHLWSNIKTIMEV